MRLEGLANLISVKGHSPVGAVRCDLRHALDCGGSDLPYVLTNLKIL